MATSVAYRSNSVTTTGNADGCADTGYKLRARGRMIRFPTIHQGQPSTAFSDARPTISGCPADASQTTAPSSNKVSDTIIVIIFFLFVILWSTRLPENAAGTSKDYILHCRRHMCRSSAPNTLTAAYPLPLPQPRSSLRIEINTFPPPPQS